MQVFLLIAAFPQIVRNFSASWLQFSANWKFLQFYLHLIAVISTKRMWHFCNLNAVFSAFWRNGHKSYTVLSHVCLFSDFCPSEQFLTLLWNFFFARAHVTVFNWRKKWTWWHLATLQTQPDKQALKIVAHPTRQIIIKRLSKIL